MALRWGILLDDIPVQLWRLVQAGGWGGSGIIIALQGIMNGLLFAGLLRPHLFFIPAERDGGRAAQQQRGDEIKMSDMFGFQD